MGFSKVIYLYCDGQTNDCECQDNWEASVGDSEFGTVAEYKKAMIRTGWLFKKNNKAYCPGCRKTAANE